MSDLVLIFDGIGEATMFIVDEKTYDILHDIYKNQKPYGYSDMMDDLLKKLDERQKKGSAYVKSVYLQYNSSNNLKEPVTFKRILQLLYE